MDKKIDMVNHPPHYTEHGMECIDAMLVEFNVDDVIAFCKLNAFKYLYRAPYKGSLEEDMQKANWYLSKAKELKRGE